MKIKTKLIASIMSICLVCAVFAIGVFALKTANLKIGGDVSFNATGVEATITNISVNNTTLEGFEEFNIDNTMSQTDLNNKISELGLNNINYEFAEDATEIPVKISIKNITEELNTCIEVDYNCDWAETSIGNIDVFPDVDNNDYIINKDETTTLTFFIRLLNEEVDAGLDNLSINLMLKYQKIGTGTQSDDVMVIDGVSYELNTTNKTANVSNIEASGVVDIYPVVFDGTNYYDVISYDIERNISGLNGAEPIFHNSLKEGYFNIQEAGLTEFHISKSLKQLDIHVLYCPLDELILGNNIQKASIDGWLEILYVSNSVKEIYFGMQGLLELQFSDCSNWYRGTVDGLSSFEEIAFSETDFAQNVELLSLECTISKIENLIIEQQGDFAFYRTDADHYLVLYDYTGAGGVINFPTIEGGYRINSVFDEVKGTITAINFPNCPTKISSGAFSGCTNLIVSNLNNVVEIDYDAFDSSVKFANNALVIPASVKKISSGAFFECSFNITFEVTEGWLLYDGSEYDVTTNGLNFVADPSAYDEDRYIYRV